MTDIGLTAKIGDSSTKFEIWFRKRKPNDTFTLQATSEDVKKLWTEELSKLLWKQAMKNREIRLQEMSSMGIGNKPCLDIRPSADNINDRSISISQLKTAPRFRNSIVGPVSELCRSNNRPHSIISVSSISSGSTSSQGSGGTLGRHMPTTGHLSNLGYDPVDSPHIHHRSHTLNSQCSMESGIIADISIGSDDCPEPQLISNNSSCWPLQKSNSQHSTNSNSTKFITSSSQTEETQTHITLYHVPDDVTINI